MAPRSRLATAIRARAHAALGWTAYQLGWAEIARRRYERVLMLLGADFRAYVQLGRIAFDQGDYAGWRREFEHARRTDPSRFARLHHPLELFEPRLAGTRLELRGLRAPATNSIARGERATWSDEASDDSAEASGRDGARGDRPHAPRDQSPGSHPPNSQSPGSQSPGSHPPNSQSPGSPAPGDAVGDQELLDLQGAADPFGAVGGSLPPSDPTETPTDAPEDPLPPLPPDASVTRDDFSSASERRRFELRRPIHPRDIARCNLSDLARRLGG